MIFQNLTTVIHLNVNDLIHLSQYFNLLLENSNFIYIFIYAVIPNLPIFKFMNLVIKFMLSINCNKKSLSYVKIIYNMYYFQRSLKFVRSISLLNQ